MKKRVINFIVGVLQFFINTFYRKPKYSVGLLFHSELYKHPSYYPERKQKSCLKIYFEQLIQIWKYGTPNEFYFMYGLDVKSKEEMHTYMHYIPFMERRDKLNLDSLHNSTCILRNKFYFGLFADALGIKTPQNIAYVQNEDVFLIAEKKHISIEYFINSGDYDLFCKVLDGECGKGIFKLKIVSGNLYCDGVSIKVEQLKQKLRGAEYLFQLSIIQHPEMSRMYDKAINSMRLVTVRNLKDGNIVVMPSILRIGTNGSIVDNTSQGGIAVGFDLQTGQLHKYGFFKPQYGFRVTEHPNSHIVFQEFYIPCILQAVEMAKHFHSMLHDIHSVGWDIAISKDGPIFIEGNDNWEINGPQVGNYGLKNEFNEYFFEN